MTAAMNVLSGFAEGLKVKLEWISKATGYAFQRVQLPEDAEHPFLAAILMLGFGDYWEHYKEIVHLGICRQCEQVYLTPRHGQKQRYCSRACQQKAYRVRKAEREEQGG